MLTQVSSSVFCWSEIHGAARNEPYPWNSFVVRTDYGDGLVLVDPFPLFAEDARGIEAMGKPAHILLTCEYHLRESEASGIDGVATSAFMRTDWTILK